MKYFYYSVVFFFFGFLISSILLFYKVVAKEREVPTYPKHDLSICYPDIKNKKLKKIVIEKLETLKQNFLEEIKDISIENHVKFTFTITYQEYTFEDYVSYAFFIESYLGGTSSNTKIWTITYDRVKEKEIELEDFSYYSEKVRESLLLDPRIVSIDRIFYQTEPKKENFSNFVFTENGILFYFLPNEIASYSNKIITSLVEYEKKVTIQTKTY